jgi:hypothetical protein
VSLSPDILLPDTYHDFVSPNVGQSLGDHNVVTASNHVEHFTHSSQGFSGDQLIMLIALP